MLLTNNSGRNIQLNLKKINTESITDLVHKTESKYQATLKAIHVSEKFYNLIPHIVSGVSIYCGSGFSPHEVVLSLIE